MFKSKIYLGLACTLIIKAASAYAEITKTTDTVVVTATKEAKSKSELAESVSVIGSDEIDFVAPAHPAEILNRSAGVYVNNIGGEGHMTSIRQPISTNGVYLFLEDGLPTRPTGLFNHNALYEINIPQSDRIEITKGPGSALYGSDSIGGIINSITKASPKTKELEINPEFGSYGWKRLLASQGAPINQDLGYRVDFNLTDNDGYRDESDYSRVSSTIRFDSKVKQETNVKTIFSYNHINQSGVSTLEASDYRNNPTENFYHNDVARREVNALRLSSEFAYEKDAQTLYTITPFVRHNKMKLMPSWMLSYDPNDRDYNFNSFGFLTKYRTKIADKKLEFITGLDVDYTPSKYKEIELTTTQSGDVYTSTTATGTINYDFDANQLSISPYLHYDWQKTDKLKLTAGLRYDYFYVDYTDNLTTSASSSHLRPDSEDLYYDHFSPKFGLVYDLNKNHNLYANYRNSFRTPAIGQLFRSGSTTNTQDLKPVNTDSFEIGSRGILVKSINYELAFYHMIVKDDIVSYIDSSDRKITNAGKTKHQGIELSLNGDLTEEWSFKTSFSYSRQKYEDFTAIYGYPATEINYAGNYIGKAPRTMGNFALEYFPLSFSNTHFEFEWEHLGDYYTDETNTSKYAGHNLFNLRVNHQLSRKVELYGRIQNIADKRYSVYTSNQVGSSDIQYRPGLPRTFFMGLRARF